MRLTIHHDTHYRYDRPVRFSAQYLRLTPPSNPAQRVIRWQISAPGHQHQWIDAFGNVCHTLVCDYVTDEIVISATGLVETADTVGILPRDESGLPVEVFLRSTPLTLIDARIRDFAEPFRSGMRTDRIPALHQLMMALRDAIDYREGETHVRSTASEALKDGAGVCQDHAHAFVACARAVGVPARYVSGYLYTGEDEAPSVAGHAWAAAWVERLGWVSFDVANRVSATERHIALAVGLDYGGASPVRGVRQGGSSGEDLAVQVRVAQA